MDLGHCSCKFFLNTVCFEERSAERRDDAADRPAMSSLWMLSSSPGPDLVHTLETKLQDNLCLENLRWIYYFVIGVSNPND